MIVKFANTFGYVYDGQNSTIDASFLKLGKTFLYQDNVIIVDRYSHSIESHLDINTIIDILKTLYYKIYKEIPSMSSDNDDGNVIQIYLPRMSLNMGTEAFIQSKLINLLSDDDNKLGKKVRLIFT